MIIEIEAGRGLFTAKFIGPKVRTTIPLNAMDLSVDNCAIGGVRPFFGGVEGLTSPFVEDLPTGMDIPSLWKWARAKGLRTNVAIALALGISEKAAAQRVARARQAGLIPPTSAGRRA